MDLSWNQFDEDEWNGFTDDEWEAFTGFPAVLAPPTTTLGTRWYELKFPNDRYYIIRWYER